MSTFFVQQILFLSFRTLLPMDQLQISPLGLIFVLFTPVRRVLNRVQDLNFFRSLRLSPVYPGQVVSEY